MVTGSIASSYYGEPRATRDLDIVIDPDVDSLDVLVDGLAADGFYVDRDAAHDALDHRAQFNAIGPDALKVDFMIRKRRPFSVEEFERRQPADLLGTAGFVASAEDLIVAKLEWAAESESDGFSCVMSQASWPSAATRSMTLTCRSGSRRYASQRSGTEWQSHDVCAVAAAHGARRDEVGLSRESRTGRNPGSSRACSIADRSAQVLHQEDEVKTVCRRRLEADAKPEVEIRSQGRLCMDEECPDAGAVRDRGALKEGVFDERRAESPALLGDVNAKPREDHHRNRVAADALRDPGWGTVVRNRPRRESVVADDAPLVQRADHVDLRRVGLMRLARMAPEPICLFFGSAVERL